MNIKIPLLRPKLPRRSALECYLNRIDTERIYSNFGPLVGSLEKRLAARHGLAGNSVVTMANATIALTASLVAQDPPPGSLCVMPAWTFIATPLAALGAGLKPYFVDVSEDWVLHPDAATSIIKDFPGKIGAVIPVAPFGLPIEIKEWDQFHANTGIAVVVDAAAAFDTITPSKIPSVVSLHATKSLGAGEGGYVISTDAPLVQRIRTFSAFGFSGSRESVLPGFNAKMSEYTAAVALAGLDEWSETRKSMLASAAIYSNGFESTKLVSVQPGFGKHWVTNTCVVELPKGTSSSIAKALSELGIESRSWWGNGAHAHTSTAHLPRQNLSQTERLAQCTLGLPFYSDIPKTQITEVVENLLRCVAHRT